MMRKLAGRSAFTIFLVGLLSLLLAVPPAHADLWDDYAKQNKIPNSSKYMYSYDSTRRSWVPNSWRYGPNYQPLAPSINPAGGNPVNPANTPLTGKIIEPGKTIVRAPSTYIPTALRFGLGGLLGTAGLGIGGTSLAPANSRELALARGVTADCYDNNTGCNSTMLDQMMQINSCGNLTGASSCDAIGAKGSQGENFAQDWFKTDALPFLEDLWNKITGQKHNDDAPDSHIVAKGYGCNISYAIQHVPETNELKLHGKVTAQHRGRDASNITLQQRWDNGCSPSQVHSAEAGTNNHQIRTTCIGIDPNVPLSFNKLYYGTGWLGTKGAVTGNAFEIKDGVPTSTYNTCGRPASEVTVLHAEIVNLTPQSSISTTSGWGLVDYSYYINPNPTLAAIEDVRATTSWTCVSGDGTQYTYSKTVGKTSAIVSPDCPVGSSLLKHDVKTQLGSDPGTVRTIDSGATDPAAVAKYPECFKPSHSPAVLAAVGGCNMKVILDGEPCQVSKPECHTWPEINRTQQSRVSCQWGTYTVPTSDCLILQDGYRSEAGVVFDPRSGTWTAIDVYGQPLAQNPQPWNPTNPNPVAGTTPGTGTPPATGTTPGTGFPGTGSNPQTNDNCSAPGWSWNPVEWVKNPVVCALRDAFEPKTDIAARIGGIKDTAMTKPPLSWMPVFTGPGGGGCPDWSVTVPGFGSKNVVCDSSFTGAIVAARYPMFGLLTAAMIWPLFRSLWYAAIPIMRVHPSR